MLVKSIFLSINGECCKAGQGSWTIFVRFVGCTANCNYCDTKYAFAGGDDMSAQQIITEIEKIGGDHMNVTLTGGEPLEQDFGKLCTLIEDLELMGYQISIETNGVHMEKIHTLINDFSNQSFVIDYKLPSAGEVYCQMKNRSFYGLPRNCFVKFVIKTRKDFDMAIGKAIKIYNTGQSSIYFSPCGIEVATQLFQWMKESIFIQSGKLNVEYNFQIHKVIFPEDNWRLEEK